MKILKTSLNPHGKIYEGTGGDISERTPEKISKGTFEEIPDWNFRKNLLRNITLVGIPVEISGTYGGILEALLNPCGRIGMMNEL